LQKSVFEKLFRQCVCRIEVGMMSLSYASPKKNNLNFVYLNISDKAL